MCFLQSLNRIKRDTRPVLGDYCAFGWCNLIYFPVQGMRTGQGSQEVQREEGAFLLLQLNVQRMNLL